MFKDRRKNEQSKPNFFRIEEKTIRFDSNWAKKSWKKRRFVFFWNEDKRRRPSIQKKAKFCHCYPWLSVYPPSTKQTNRVAKLCGFFTALWLNQSCWKFQRLFIYILTIWILKIRSLSLKLRILYDLQCSFFFGKFLTVLKMYKNI